MNFRWHGPCMVLGPAMEGGPEGGPEGKILKFQPWRGAGPPGPPIVGNPARNDEIYDRPGAIQIIGC